VGAHVIDGRGLAAELKGRLAAEVADFMEAGVVPGLATVLVGSPAEAEAYERRVRKLAGEWGTATPARGSRSTPRRRR
jgi:methylenetetrahydrofolate dehydrogenase (NADP+)/methenyltetrahydrofolate cyclohydrolase